MNVKQKYIFYFFINIFRIVGKVDGVLGYFICQIYMGIFDIVGLVCEIIYVYLKFIGFLIQQMVEFFVVLYEKGYLYMCD